MDEPRAPRTDEPPLEQAATAVRAWWVRLLHGAGVGAVWAVGLGVVVVALGILFALWFSGRPEGGRITVSLANRGLARVSNLKLSAERSFLLEHGLRLVRPVVSVIDSSGAEHRLVEAEEAIVRTSWWRVLRGTPETFEIDLAGPHVTFTRGRDGRLVLPVFRRSNKKPSPLARTTVRLKLDGGGVRFTRPDGGLDTLARDVVLNGHATQAGTRWTIALDRVTGVLPRAGIRLHRVDLAASYDEGRLEVPHFQARSSAGWIAGDARGTVVPRVDLSGNLEAGEWEWRRVAAWTRQPALDIPGGFAGGFAFRARRDTVEIDDGAFDVRWREEPLRLAADGRWIGGRLDLSGAALDWRDTSFRGRFLWDTEPGGGWTADGNIARLDLSKIPRLWPMPALDPSSIDGRFHLARKGGVLEGQVEEAHGRWRDIPFTDLGGTWAMRGRSQELDAQARVAGGTVGAAGTIGPGGLDLDATASHVTAEALPAAWWESLGLAHPPSGQVESLTVRLHGPSGAPEVTGTAHVVDLAYDSVSVGDATFDFDGRLGRASDVAVTGRVFDLEVGFARADTTDLVARLGSERIAVSSFRAARGDSVLVLSGLARRVGGGWDVALDSLAWHIGASFDLRTDGPARARVEPDGAVRIDHLRVVSGAGSLAASGTWGRNNRATDLTLELEKLDVESLLAPFAPGADARGLVTGRARVAGYGDALHWTLDLEGRDLRWRAFDAPRLVARGRFAGSTWEVERLELDTRRGRLSFQGDVAWARPPDLGGGPAAWNTALTEARAWNGVLVADSLALDPIAQWVPALGGWRGSLDATFTLAGRPADPSLTVKGTLRQPGWGQATLDDFALDLHYEDEVVRVHRFAMAGPDSVGPAVQGTLPLRLGWGVSGEERLPDRPMDLTLFAHGLDLSLVPLVLPQIAAAGGRFDLDARLTGTPRKPVVEGDMTVRDGVVRPASREEVLTGVNGRFVLRGDRLEIASLSARQGEEGTFVVRPGGFGTIRNLRLESYELAVDVRKGTGFSSGEYVLVIDGEFRIEDGVDLGGPLPLPHITGTARVREGMFLYNFADPSRQLATQGPLKQPPWTYVIDVEALNNVWYRPVDANIEARLTDFQVVQEMDQFYMLGGVEALRGRYYFLANGFEVEEGTMTFDATRLNDPLMNARLTTEKVLEQGLGERETITLTVTGRASKPNVTLTSSPSALSQTDIVTLLTYGQLEAGRTAVVTAGSQYLVRQLTREFPELNEYFGEVELGQTVSEEDVGTNTAAQTYTTVNLTRYFTRDLLVRYSQVVGDVSQSSAVDYQDLTAEYRLNRLLILSGQVTRRRGVLVTSSQDRTIYNLDVRARHEY
jgi:autotransporter translocation and assembly factor TamB